MKRSFFIRWICLLAFIATFAGCDEAKEYSFDQVIYLDARAVDLYYGDERQITASPSTERDEIRWTSEDPAVATVSASGLIKAVGVGETRVFAALASGTTTLPVTVTIPTVDKVTGRPGNRRAGLELAISNDRIKTVKVTRTDNDQSQETNVNYQSGTITVSYTGLAEGRYPFRVICIDRYDNESVPIDLYVSVYGDIYQSTLTRMEANVASKFGNGLTVSWKNQTGNWIEIFYNNEAGQPTAKIVSVTANSTHIADFGSGPVSYNTLYLPESTAVDTFRIGPVSYTGTITDYTTYIRSSPDVSLVNPSDFDLGGEGVGFHDSNTSHDPGSGGANYRPSRGDTQSAAMDTEGDGGNIGYTNAGEWLAYTVDVMNEGDYEIDWYISVNGDNASCRIEVDGVSSDVYKLENNNNWSDWRYYCERNSINPPKFHLTVGKHKVMYYFSGGDHNYNGLRFTYK
ncbi:MAG: carbohydrate-binding protein [Prevotellaceae bacterium]|nr:carbohydrate-binding protein [Prevotellaceae bacterium]